MHGQKSGEQNLFEIPGQLELDRLPPFLRVLLTTDGTVTKSLEAFFWEKISVDASAQSILELAEDMPYLNSTRGESVTSRHVQLRGVHSDKVYAKAQSLIRYDLLPKSFQRDLNDQKLGVGELVRECGLETYREILSLGEDKQTKQVWRIYRIVMEHQPFIQIKEYFPVCLYQPSASKS